MINFANFDLMENKLVLEEQAQAIFDLSILNMDSLEYKKGLKNFNKKYACRFSKKSIERWNEFFKNLPLFDSYIKELLERDSDMTNICIKFVREETCSYREVFKFVVCFNDLFQIELGRVFNITDFNSCDTGYFNVYANKKDDNISLVGIYGEHKLLQRISNLLDSGRVEECKELDDKMFDLNDSCVKYNDLFNGVLTPAFSKFKVSIR